MPSYVKLNQCDVSGEGDTLVNSLISANGYFSWNTGFGNYQLSAGSDEQDTYAIKITRALAAVLSGDNPKFREGYIVVNNNIHSILATGVKRATYSTIWTKITDITTTIDGKEYHVAYTVLTGNYNSDYFVERIGLFATIDSEINTISDLLSLFGELGIQPIGETYPITYSFTNSIVSGPSEAAVGDTVIVSAVPDVGYGITDASTQILVTNSDVAIPYTWDATNQRITFTMPQPVENRGGFGSTGQ